jgi:hypothetical protein
MPDQKDAAVTVLDQSDDTTPKVRHEHALYHRGEDERLDPSPQARGPG